MHKMPWSTTASASPEHEKMLALIFGSEISLCPVCRSVGQSVGNICFKYPSYPNTGFSIDLFQLLNESTIGQKYYGQVLMCNFDPME